MRRRRRPRSSRRHDTSGLFDGVFGGQLFRLRCPGAFCRRRVPPANLFNASTFRKSSPSSSTGVSRINGFPRSPGCRRILAKPRLPNPPLPDIFMPVQARSQLTFRIVRMDHLHQLQPQRTICRGHRLLQPRRLRQVETRCQQVTGIQAISDRQIRLPRSQIANCPQLFKPRTRSDSRRPPYSPAAP